MTTQEILNSPGVLAALHAFIAFWGFIECFFGWRLIRFLIVLTGIFIGSAVGAFAGGLFPQEQLLIAVPIGIILGAIIFALLAYRLFQVAVFILGGLVGAMIVSSLIRDLGEPAHTVILVISGIVAGAITLVLMRPMVILAMALSGSAKIIVGIGFFLGLIAFEPWDHTASETVHTVADTPLLLIAFLGISATGAIFQFWTTRSKVSKE